MYTTQRLRHHEEEDRPCFLGAVTSVSVARARTDASKSGTNAITIVWYISLRVTPVQANDIGEQYVSNLCSINENSHKLLQVIWKPCDHSTQFPEVCLVILPSFPRTKEKNTGVFVLKMHNRRIFIRKNKVWSSVYVCVRCRTRMCTRVVFE